MLANSSSLNSRVGRHNIEGKLISNVFARNILIFVLAEPILRTLTHILQEKRAKTKYKHMVNYRGVKLCEATCSQQPKPYRPMISKNVIMQSKGSTLLIISICPHKVA